MTAWFFRWGSFSHINDHVERGLKSRFPGESLRSVDVLRDIIEASPRDRLVASACSVLRYGDRVLKNRQNPRDFFLRFAWVWDRIRTWSATHAQGAAFTFQTQSMFDARCDGVPHFVYTDHTLAAGRRYGIPGPSPRVDAAWRKREADLYRHASIVFTTSSFAARSVVEDYACPENRVLNVYSGTNLRFPAEEEVAAGGTGIILFVGVDWERKGGPELVEAFRKLRAQHSQAQLWIVGCNPPVDEPGIRALGRVPLDEVRELYRQASIFCLPSRQEPSATVLLEAASFGLPVVSTDVGGTLDRVHDGQTGRLVRPLDADGLTAALGGLLADPQRARTLGEEGRRMVARDFRWDPVCDRIAEGMRKVLGP